MTKKPTDLDDIAIAVSDLTTMIGERFVQVDQRFSGVENDLARIYAEIANIREQLVKIDNRLSGLESDITEIYDTIVLIQAKDVLTPKDKKELERQLNALFEWAKQVSKQTGITLPKL